MLTNVRFHNAGYCMQNEFFTGTGTFRWRRFQAVFVSFDHPKHGCCLIDTGYGPMFLEATARLPGWIMRKLLYTPAEQPVFQPDFLEQLGLDPSRISHVFVSHFHADHIGGLSRFPSSTLVYRDAPLQWLKTLSSWRQLHHGFLPKLWPDDADQRAFKITESDLSIDEKVSRTIPVLDFWNDGSLVLMDLPGHGIGHTGYLLNTDHGKIGYVVDAFWDSRTFQQKRHLPWPARRVQYAVREYEMTLDRLRQFQQDTQIPLLACHCEATQQYVQHKD